MENKIKELEADLAELQTLAGQSTRAKVKDVLTVAIKKTETEISRCKDDLKRLQGGENKESSTITVIKNMIPEVQLKDYSWDQSDKFVKIYLTGLTGLGSHSNDAVTSQFTNESVNVRIENLNGKTYLFNIKKTCHKISPDKSYVKMKSDYLLICMSKYNQGSHWSHMTHAEKAAADAKKAVDTKIANDDDPSGGLMNMMKKLYDEGDDEMKRTIAKAWTESRDKTGPGQFSGLGEL